jgi:hypothetical protein
MYSVTAAPIRSVGRKKGKRSTEKQRRDRKVKKKAGVKNRRRERNQ